MPPAYSDNMPARDMLVTVIGGSGFLGRHVVRCLAETGARIRVATRHPNDANFLRPMGTIGQIAPIQTNIRNPESLRAAIDGADAVVNLIGVMNNSGAQTIDAINIAGAATVARLCADLDIARLVHLSAIGADIHAQSRYARSKGLGEQAVTKAFPGVTIMRPSIVFGPEDNFFNRFAGLARILPVLPLIGGGHTRFQPVYAGDIAQAVTRILDDNGTRGQIYELGGPNVVSFREILTFILATINRQRALVPIPFGLASFMGVFLQFMPWKLLTPDQVTLLRQDNVVAAEALTLADLGIEPTPVETVVPQYLARFRP